MMRSVPRKSPSCLSRTEFQFRAAARPLVDERLARLLVGRFPHTPQHQRDLEAVKAPLEEIAKLCQWRRGGTT
jgi:hypothetical protein